MMRTSCYKKITCMLCCSERFPGEPVGVLGQDLDRKRRSEVGIHGPDQLKRVLPDTGVQAMVRRPTAPLVDQSSTTILAILDQTVLNVQVTPGEKNNYSGSG